MKTTERIFSRPGAAAGTVGALMALQVVLLGVLGSATTESVTFAGRELHWGCSFREWFGIPCPNCGMTRSVLLSLHGQLTEAVSLNPAGPLLVLGILLFSAAMFFLMAYESRHTGTALARARSSITRGSLAYAALMLVVWMGHWVRAIS
ncbi:MAG TPA: DUF2752 domain-containing protein [Pyrinomonadaceae bacterium]